jgi:hypothetical protein
MWDGHIEEASHERSETVRNLPGIVLSILTANNNPSTWYRNVNPLLKIKKSQAGSA